MKKTIIAAIALTTVITSGVAISAEKEGLILKPSVVSSVPAGYEFVNHRVEKNRDIYSYEKKEDNLNYERFLVSGFSGSAVPNVSTFASSQVATMSKICASGFSSYIPKDSADNSFVTKCDSVTDGNGVKRSVLTAVKFVKTGDTFAEVKWFKYTEPSFGNLTSAEKELALKSLGEVKI